MKQIKTIKIKDLVPFDRNPRKNDAAVDRVLESLKNNGYVAPIIVSEVGAPFQQHVVCVGHTRLKALKKFGAKEVDCIVHSFESEAQFIRYNIEDNKTSEFADWDEQILADLSAEFDIDLDGMGFDFEEKNIDDDDHLTIDDNVPNDETMHICPKCNFKFKDN